MPSALVTRVTAARTRSAGLVITLCWSIVVLHGHRTGGETVIAEISGLGRQTNIVVKEQP